MPSLPKISLPLPAHGPPDGFTLPVEPERDSFHSSNEPTIETTDKTTRCVVCSTTITVQNCHLIPTWDTHTWNILKAKNYIPSESKSIDQEVKNTISMCSAHITSFERCYFFIRYIPELRQHVFVNYSGIDDPMLTPFHGKSILLDVEDTHTPFPTLFLIHEQRVRGFWPLAQEPEIEIHALINQESELQARCDLVTRQLQQLTWDTFDEVSDKIIEIINFGYPSPKAPSSTFIPPRFTLQKPRPKVTLRNGDGVQVQLEKIIKPTRNASPGNDTSTNCQSLEDQDKRQKREEEERKMCEEKNLNLNLEKSEEDNELKKLPRKALERIIDLIYCYATISDANNTEVIAHLLRKIVDKTSTKIQDDRPNIKSSDSKPIAGGQILRKYLLRRCQQDFERGWDANESTSIEEYEVVKRRYLAFIRLMSELFKLQMLSERIMHWCIQALLNRFRAQERYFEGLCTLLLVAGEELDSPRSHAHMDVYVSRMKEYTTQNISPRIRSMLQDVINLRKSGWVADSVKLLKEKDYSSSDFLYAYTSTSFEDYGSD